MMRYTIALVGNVSFIPPRVVDIHKYASYDDVLKIGHGLFFTDEIDDLSRYALCGTCARCSFRDN